MLGKIWILLENFKIFYLEWFTKVTVPLIPAIILFCGFSIFALKLTVWLFGSTTESICKIFVFTSIFNSSILTVISSSIFNHDSHFAGTTVLISSEFELIISYSSSCGFTFWCLLAIFSTILPEKGVFISHLSTFILAIFISCSCSWSSSSAVFTSNCPTELNVLNCLVLSYFTFNKSLFILIIF